MLEPIKHSTRCPTCEAKLPAMASCPRCEGTGKIWIEIPRPDAPPPPPPQALA